jgi:hypothetical protein
MNEKQRRKEQGYVTEMGEMEGHINNLLPPSKENGILVF